MMERGRCLTESLIGHADDGDVVHFWVAPDHALYFDGIDVFYSGDDQIFLSVHNGDEPVLIDFTEISGVQPSVFNGGGRQLRILVIFFHHPRSAHHHLTYFIRRHINTPLVHDANIPEKTWFPNSPDLFFVLGTKVSD